MPFRRFGASAERVRVGHSHRTISRSRGGAGAGRFPADPARTSLGEGLDEILRVLLRSFEKSPGNGVDFLGRLVGVDLTSTTYFGDGYSNFFKSRTRRFKRGS